MTPICCLLRVLTMAHVVFWDPRSEGLVFPHAFWPDQRRDLQRVGEVLNSKLPRIFPTVDDRDPA